MPSRKRGGSVPEEVKPVFEEVVGLVEGFCHQYLNPEYAALCRRLAEKLARKRPSPLLDGKPQTWACGIVRTIGWLNLLEEDNQNPHLSFGVIDKAFGISQSAGEESEKKIRRMLKIRATDPQWILPSRMAANPLFRML